MELKEAVGDTLRKLRLSQGKSLRELTPYISIGHLSDSELGNKQMSWELLSEVCKGLEVTPADFLMEVANYIKENEYVG
jgi:transcriptional regulator with XRE-family HTH domain